MTVTTLLSNELFQVSKVSVFFWPELKKVPVKDDGVQILSYVFMYLVLSFGIDLFQFLWILYWDNTHGIPWE